MELSAGFLIYAAVFRLAVIAVGVVAIVLGYLLFVRASIVKGRTETGLEIAKFKLNLKNAAPGTCFAAFGAGIVLAMLIEGSPSLTLETAQTAVAEEQATQTLRMKGQAPRDHSPSLALDLGQAAQHLRDGEPALAMAAYSRLLETRGLTAAEAALALEPMARIALDRDEFAQGETLARLAVLFSGGAPDALDTLARILIAREESAEAVALARQAVEATPNEPRFLHTLAIALVDAGERQEAAEVIDQAARLDAVYGTERDRLLGDSQ